MILLILSTTDILYLFIIIIILINPIIIIIHIRKFKFKLNSYSVRFDPNLILSFKFEDFPDEN
jgi:hypothetical protein